MLQKWIEKVLEELPRYLLGSSRGVGSGLGTFLGPSPYGDSEAKLNDAIEFSTLNEGVYVYIYSVYVV